MKRTTTDSLQLSPTLEENSQQQSLTDAQYIQYKNEKKLRDELLGKRHRKDDEMMSGGRASNTMVSKGILRSLVPGSAYWLDHHIEAVKRRGTQRAGVSYAEITRMAGWIPIATMTHIATSVILDSLGRGSTFKRTVASVQMSIGRQVEHQAFIQYMMEVDPFYFTKLQKWYLHDPIRRYDKKIAGMVNSHNKHELMDWQWMSDTQLVRVGSLLLKAVMSVPVDGCNEGLFEKKNISRGKEQVGYLGYSKTGIRYRDVLQGVVDRMTYKPEPMLCEPLPWSLEKRGGYIIPPPSPWCDLIHLTLSKECGGTKPSQTALDALNKLQSVPYRVNQFILDVQLLLLEKSHKIGSFRSFEKDSWNDEHFPRVDSEWLDTLDKESKEYKETMRMLTNTYKRQKLDEKEACTPRRVVNLAEKLRNDVFWTPWFFDTRLRLYPQSELSITQGDYTKALLVSAKEMPVNEDTKRELLIAIATSGGFDKIDKADYFARMQWAAEFVKTGEFLHTVTDPIDSHTWRSADEPFQFLAYCEEYYAIFVAETRDTTRVFVGRDMTCSGIQILSSIIGDEKAMKFTNVLPGEFPEDAYGEVARSARELLQDKAWLSLQYEKGALSNEKWNKKQDDEQNHREDRNIIEIPLDEVDRSLAKKPVMLTGYGGTYRTKRGHILDELKDRKVELHPQDKSILVSSLIEGMQQAFPAYTELNQWFKGVVKAAFENNSNELNWVTPNGSEIVQNYREPLYARVTTHAATGGHYARLMSDDNAQTTLINGYGDPASGKHATAVAANFTHSLDATIIQDGNVAVADGIPCITVHDCVYFQPGYSKDVVPKFRQAFHNVVTTPVLENLIHENGLEGQVEMLEKKNVDVSSCKESAYMFC